MGLPAGSVSGGRGLGDFKVLGQVAGRTELAAAEMRTAVKGTVREDM